MKAYHFSDEERYCQSVPTATLRIGAMVDLTLPGARLVGSGIECANDVDFQDQRSRKFLSVFPA